MPSDWLKIPNVISLGRLILLVPTAYFLSQPGPLPKICALIFLTLAAVSDFLDGFLARKLKQQTQLGRILDPLSDKLLAGILAVFLIAYRDFPLWLAGVIIGRDILIALGGIIIKNKLEAVPKSTLTGKYCFAATAVLLICYVIEFPFGIMLFTGFTLIFIALSLLFYGRAFYRVLIGKPMTEFSDKLSYRYARITLVWIVIVVFFYKLFEFIGWIQ